jgi:sortilin-related receptor
VLFPLLFFADPTEPLNVSAGQINGSRVQVSWESPKEVNGFLDSYTVYYRPQSINVGPAQSVKVSSAETSIIIESEFRPNVTYEFWVKSKNRKQESLSSKLVQLKFDGTSNIDAISDLVVAAVSTTGELTLSWTKAANAEGYIIQPILPQPYPRVEPIRVKAPPTKLKNLVPGVQYVFKVSAFVGSYIGRHDTIIFQMPAKPLPEVSNIAVTYDNQKNEVHINWKKITISDLGKITYGIYYGQKMDELFAGEYSRKKTFSR